MLDTDVRMYAVRRVKLMSEVRCLPPRKIPRRLLVLSFMLTPPAAHRHLFARAVTKWDQAIQDYVWVLG